MINSMKYLCSCSPIPCSVTDVEGSRFLNPAMKSLLGFVGDEDSVGLESSHGIEVFAAQENRCFERKSPFLAVNSLPYGSEQKMQPWIFYFFPLPDCVDGNEVERALRKLGIIYQDGTQSLYGCVGEGIYIANSSEEMSKALAGTAFQNWKQHSTRAGETVPSYIKIGGKCTRGIFIKNS